ncbi:MAG: DCC1-like thiol-disulfide oxidoreductase family protein [Rubrivivax sp.]
MTRPLLLFDGDCALCDRTVGFVLRHERAPEFLFVPLGSPAARLMLAPKGVDADALTSMLVLIDGRVLRESGALIAVLARLRSPWRCLRFVSLVPGRLRDAAYRFIGARRYRWWGRQRGPCALDARGARARVITSSADIGEHGISVATPSG